VTGYDIVGDIHGHVEKLRRLLTKLGYAVNDGVYRHPARKVIFVGDFIDRGPDIRATLELVRPMIDSGAAFGILGNHEFNALRFQDTGDPRLAAGLRNTLQEFADEPEEWDAWLAWFRQLPLFLEVGGLRVVHAVWDSTMIAKLRGLRPEVLWSEALKPGSEIERMATILLNGWQVPLPGETNVEEFQGSTRSFTRAAWWKNDSPVTLRQVSFPFDPALPEIEIAESIRSQLPGYGSDEPPVFFGHYALPPDMLPWPQAGNVACVDYRAAKKGPLVAYRWDGESCLEAKRFVTPSD
jgi:hypothetical protein